jgi:hypothetical protein
MIEIKVPHNSAYDFGIGVDRLSGSAMNMVVNAGEPSTVIKSDGIIQSFEVGRVSNSSDLQQKLEIDIEASYGCATFGAGASARFSYMKETEIHSSSMFMTVTATVHLADLSIDHSVLTEQAAAMVDRKDIFAARYGNMFCRSCKRGGLFVGVLQVVTNSQEDTTKIEGELSGTYGFFSAEAAAKFNEILNTYNAKAYCSVYAEGGPPIQIKNTNDASEFLKHANDWMLAFQNNPDQYAVPYEWTLSPITIAEGPLPLNEIQIQKAQDILKFCARERTSLLDQLNQLTWIISHPDKVEWANAASDKEIRDAARAVQVDLDTIADCAIAAINSPGDAVFPAVFAGAKGGSYPSAVIPSKLPTPTPTSTPATPATPIPTNKPFDPSLVGVRADNTSLNLFGRNR